MHRKEDTELKTHTHGCVDRDRLLRETWRGRRKQEIEIQRKEPEKDRQTDREDQREGQNDTKKSRTSPTKGQRRAWAETEVAAGRRHVGQLKR